MTHDHRHLDPDSDDLRPVAAADREPGQGGAARPSVLEYLLRGAGTVVVTAAAIMFAIVEAFLVPYKLGGYYVPLSAVLAIAVNLSLPRLALWLVKLRSLALLPGLAWFVIVILGTVPTAEGDLVLHDAWPGMVMLLGGSASVAVSGYRIVTGPVRTAIKS